MTSHISDEITFQLLQEFTSFLWTLRINGFKFGHHLVLCAIPPKSGRSYPNTIQLAVGTTLTVAADYKTFGEYFGLPSHSERKIFDDAIGALVLSHSKGAFSWGPVPTTAEDVSEVVNKICGRCASLNKRKKAHQDCMQVLLNGELLLDGICTNCYQSGDTQACSFRRKFQNAAQTSLFPLAQYF